MYDFWLTCTRCGTGHPALPLYRCRACGGSLEVSYDYKAIFSRLPFERMAARTSPGIWKYRELLPVFPDTDPVTLGEGGTPLLPSGRMGSTTGGFRLYLKNESANPTLAFKDRPLSVALTAARQFGLTEVVCASTGNTGVAASAYAARAGLRCTVYVPAAAPAEKLEAMKAYGTVLETVTGSFSDAYAASAGEALRLGAFNLTSTYLNPYAVEGNKTLAYEIFASLQTVPDWIIIPVGAGPLLSGCYKGFREMLLAGVIDRLPRMVGVQASGCAPIVRAFQAGEQEVRPWSGSTATLASGIADPLSTYPEDGTRTLAVIRESGGAAVGVSDPEILRCRRMLAEREGILAELSSVTAVAAVEALCGSGAIRAGELVTAVVTGHGIKDMTAAINFEKTGVE
ncbi:threonine synthase [Paenibacillus sp. S150]|uniref:threonine synthase n=1 Tax=Paenibacillus sp. S150 TaxID=2749826 RepID=UPI001C594F3B|nr:threonine synthase [Paenibacillus sp. S150]MBW4084257.1 threonine synthase [Paenibacillus sp. S150]